MPITDGSFAPFQSQDIEHVPGNSMPEAACRSEIISDQIHDHLDQSVTICPIDE